MCQAIAAIIGLDNEYKFSVTPNQHLLAMSIKISWGFPFKPQFLFQENSIWLTSNTYLMTSRC